MLAFLFEFVSETEIDQTEVELIRLLVDLSTYIIKLDIAMQVA